MVQPVSATLISAACSARLPVVPDRGVLPASGSRSAIAVTWRGLPGAAGAAMSTPTSATCSAPGGARSSRTGTGVPTPGPSTRTVTGALAGPGCGGRSSSTVTRTICSGCPAVPPKRSVPATLVIRMAPS
jgi:hypothetical protein